MSRPLQLLLSVILLAVQLLAAVLLDRMDTWRHFGVSGLADSLLFGGFLLYLLVGWITFAFAGHKDIQDHLRQDKMIRVWTVAELPVLFVICLGVWPLIVLVIWVWGSD